MSECDKCGKLCACLRPDMTFQELLLAYHIRRMRILEIMESQLESGELNKKLDIDKEIPEFSGDA